MDEIETEIFAEIEKLENKLKEKGLIKNQENYHEKN